MIADVHLLADAFGNLGGMCLNNKGLDPAYYVTLPNYNWNMYIYIMCVCVQCKAGTNTQRGSVLDD